MNLFTPQFQFQPWLIRAMALFLAVMFTATAADAQNLDRIQRGRAKDMLNAVKKELKDKYYDPTFRGVDLDARFKVASEKLDTATTLGQTFGIIAAAVLELNDSHTTFYPPSRPAKFEYGWRMQMIGNKCFVTSVKPKSDAESKGLKAGDEIVAIEGFKPNRKEMWKMRYYYNTLSPRMGLVLSVKSPGETAPRELSIASKVTQLKTLLNFEDLVREFELSGDDKIEHRFIKKGATTVWRMPTFSFEPEAVNRLMQGRVGQSSNLILDLRGNGGGYVLTLEQLAGYFVEKDTKIADLKGRKEMKPQMAKTKGKDVFRGKLVILLDANSASASEIFARFMQLEKRAIVIGDQSAGAVMQSRGVSMEMGVDSVVPYGMNMTNADVIMGDGVSLEHAGVTPQIPMLLTGADIAAQRDPVLSAAFELLGETVPAEEAGRYFLYDWSSDN